MHGLTSFLTPLHPEGHKFVAIAAALTVVLFVIWEPLGWTGVNIWVVINFIGGALKAQSAEARLGPHLGLHWPGTVAELDGTASECWCLLCFAAAFPIGPCRVYNSSEQDMYDIPSSRSEGRQRRVCLTNPLVNHDKAMIPTCVLKVQVKLPPQIVVSADLLAPPKMDSGILALPKLDFRFLALPGLSFGLMASLKLSSP